MGTADKATLAHAIQEHTSQEEKVLSSVPSTEVVVLDGGSIHSTQNAMAQGRFIQGNCSSVHAGFTALKYWMATVVFDRYPNEPHIKERVLVLYTYDEG